MGKIDGGANQRFREERIYLSRLRDEAAMAALEEQRASEEAWEEEQRQEEGER